MRIAAAVALSLAVSACTSVPGRIATPAVESDRCERVRAAVDAAVADAGVADGQAARIAGHRYLRASRFLASYRDEPLEGAAFDQWLEALARVDRDARTVELANLPPDVAAGLRAALARDEGAALPVDLDRCEREFRARTGADPQARARLRAAVTVPDDYSDAERFLGAYPLAALAAAPLVRAYERDTRAAFAQPEAALAVRGTLRTYRARDAVAADSATIAAALERASANPLRIALPAPDDARLLLAAHAPIFVVDERDANDRIGAPAWNADGSPGVDPSAPVVTTRIAHTRFGGATLLQLVYTAWFPARPAAGAADLLAGRLDGIVWRVTLDRDGAPLVYDSIHPCGCYHWIFPTARLAERPAAPTVEEGALVPQTLPLPGPDRAVALRVEAGTHYLRRVRVGPAHAPDAVPYALVDDDALRTLPLPGGGTRSLYRPDGIVAGTERGERYWLWPFGIASAGAMRQWGRHATAFVGRRHFDEAFLFERYFDRVPEAAQRQSD